VVIAFAADGAIVVLRLPARLFDTEHRFPQAARDVNSVCAAGRNRWKNGQFTWFGSCLASRPAEDA
jgi:hypothetical protein